MPKTLKTNASVWTKVFRRIVQQVETDADIRRVVGLDNIRSWKGVAGDKNKFVPSTGMPIVRLTPEPTNVDWYSADKQAGTLVVHLEVAISTLCIDDVAGAPFYFDLVALGAETGEIVFDNPAFDPTPSDDPEGTFCARGSFRLKVLRSVLS
jgi:hypothetical protein